MASLLPKTQVVAPYGYNNLKPTTVSYVTYSFEESHCVEIYGASVEQSIDIIKQCVAVRPNLTPVTTKCYKLQQVRCILTAAENVHAHVRQMFTAHC